MNEISLHCTLLLRKTAPSKSLSICSICSILCKTCQLLAWIIKSKNENILKKQNFFGYSFFCFTFLWHENTHQESATLSLIWPVLRCLLCFLPCTQQHNAAVKLKKIFELWKKYVIHRNSHTTMHQRHWQQWETRNKSKTDCNNSTCSQRIAQE